MTIGRQLRAFSRKPHNVILAVLAVLLVFLTLFPLISLIRDTVLVHPSEVMSVRGAKIGDITNFHWRKIFLDGETSLNIFYRPFWNTIMTSLWSCVVSLLLGGSVAWLITRSDLKWKSFISTTFILPYIMPSWTLAMAWRNFFRNRLIGGAQGLFTAITGIETANWFAYGVFPIIVVQGLHYAPFAYILIGGILRNMDANLEEAAVILKTSRIKIFCRITLPIVMPAVLSTFLLVFSSCMSAFAVPAFLGMPVRFQVLTTQLYRTLNGLNPGYGYIMALVMIVIGTGILMFQQWFVGKRRSFTTVTGKSSNISLVHLKNLRLPISIILLVLVAVVAILPLISFTIESFIMAPGDYSLKNFTLQFWAGAGREDIGGGEPGILRNQFIYLGLWNSIRLSVVVAVISGTVGALAGYAIVRRRGSKLSAFVNNLAFFPYLMPSMAFGAVYLSMFARPVLFIPALYGSFALLVLVGSVKYLPFASRSGMNAMLQLSNEIEEAALIVGIPWWKRMLRIIFPIQKASFLSGYLLPFISCMRELSLFVLLIVPSTRILTTMLFQYNEKGWNQYANAINLMIILIVLLFNGVINKLTGASIDKGIGG
ncbi:ABC transporter, permease protein [Treponema primitia ZAS-2]|uniref:ABC transporter, permease protein n=1 Tax=Treponema primitia (strain ATCC BAA-887 / DSM 12427 / ZAS-2) TaxID=545694 RepID=F5YPH2_TREPZ|nr:iron ABC transporter permease [Treponema primitia]AEF85496.1 ABC transporter, permease protein [Treponema primitia ZAS-2]